MAHSLYLHTCLIVVPLPQGENPFAVKINNKKKKIGWRYSNPPLRGVVDFKIIVLLITFRHAPHRKHRSSVAVSECCRSNMLVCEAVI
jgi:hypothetical protein